MARHPEERCMFDTSRQTYDWPHMASNVYITIAKCECCVRNGSQYRHKRPLQFFPAPEPFDFIAMDILGLLPKTNQGDQFVCVMTDRYLKVARAIAMFKILSTHMANIVFDHWIISFGIPNYLLKNNEP